MENWRRFSEEADIDSAISEALNEAMSSFRKALLEAEESEKGTSLVPITAIDATQPEEGEKGKLTIRDMPEEHQMAIKDYIKNQVVKNITAQPEVVKIYNSMTPVQKSMALKAMDAIVEGQKGKLNLSIVSTLVNKLAKYGAAAHVILLPLAMLQRGINSIPKYVPDWIKTYFNDLVSLLRMEELPSWIENYIGWESLVISLTVAAVAGTIKEHVKQEK